MTSYRLPNLSVALALGLSLGLLAACTTDGAAPTTAALDPVVAQDEPHSPEGVAVSVITPEQEKAIEQEVATIAPIADPADPGRETAAEVAAEEEAASVDILTPEDFPEYAPEPPPPPAADFSSLRQQCEGKGGGSCCLASVIFMESGNFPLAPANQGTCPSGQMANQLKCATSYQWCEPATVSSVD